MKVGVNEVLKTSTDDFRRQIIPFQKFKFTIYFTEFNYTYMIDMVKWVAL